jgi:hypothetical protein
VLEDVDVDEIGETGFVGVVTPVLEDIDEDETGEAGFPIAAGVSPVYAYTGASRVGVLGSENIVARTPSPCTGLFPGSFASRPVASSRVRKT